MATLPEFDSLKVTLASPEEILGWSYGEVLKPETINYRTQKPEKDGLFCERIFGPVKNWECSCGKYKRIRYKGVICDKCGVEVTRSIVRRERMGHIRLAAPVAHVWYSRSVPNYMALLLGVSPRNLERVLYFAQYIVTSIDKEKRSKALAEIEKSQQLSEDTLKKELEEKITFSQEQCEQRLKEFKNKNKKAARQDFKDFEESAKEQLEQEKQKLRDEYNALLQQEKEEFKAIALGLERLELFQNLNERTYQKYKRVFPDVFEAEMGASAIIKIVKTLNLEKESKELWLDLKKSSGQRRKKNLKRLEIIEGMLENKIDPANMILSVLPVLPADLRPMVQLSGGRFAASDLNDLYRRVINRNNRLKKLIKLNAPEVIIRNEKRMLQEAVDALIDNSSKNRKVVMAMGKKKQKLKSLSDILRGKQGRFRQNLLGKRVDYSGRAVIVIGPELNLNQAGIPRQMAVELFKPFILRDLIKKGYASTLKSANQLIERMIPEVWDVLEEIVIDHPVLLNRAPTLHRLGIQAFFPVLVDGDAIRLHPLVCSAFNADFDGDQMAVYIPITKAAMQEVKELMISNRNLLLPASGNPTVGPTLDMVMGLYYLTMLVDTPDPVAFPNIEQALQMYNLGQIELRKKIIIYQKGKKLETTIGRILFNQVIPPELEFMNEVMTKKKLSRLITHCFYTLGEERTAAFVDEIKGLGFRYATKSGITMAIDDVSVPEKKQAIIAKADTQAAEIERQYHRGLITAEERYEHTVNLWTSVTADVTKAMIESMDRYSDLFVIMDSGARGSVEQMRQLAGMRGLMADPSGRIIDLPIKANFREGLSVLEYFISTHGARKGRSDTALRTADSGYLTRRLVDVAQSVITVEEDCGDTEGRMITWKRDQKGKILGTVLRQDIMGRILSEKVVDPKTKATIARKGQMLDEKIVAEIEKSSVTQVKTRSTLSCKSTKGVCCKCYGWNLGNGKLIKKAEAIGIVAAQSIGEPGTQLTMRNFHTGGVAGELDITQGLPRVEELFEARVPKGVAPISEIGGVVHLETKEDEKIIWIEHEEESEEVYEIPAGYKVVVKEGQKVTANRTVVAEQKKSGEAIKVKNNGKVAAISTSSITLVYKKLRKKEYRIPLHARLYVAEGEKIEAGHQLIEGSVDPHALLRISGEEAAQRYLISQIQDIYLSQGVVTHTKHIEVIVKQMFNKVRVEKSGDTPLIPKSYINYSDFVTANENTVKPAKASKVILGITKAALASDSFLSAASFQETIKVLSRAAIRGEIDKLIGLKENLIIGKLIPVGPCGREQKLKKEVVEETTSSEKQEDPVVSKE